SQISRRTAPRANCWSRNGPGSTSRAQRKKWQSSPNLPASSASSTTAEKANARLCGRALHKNLVWLLLVQRRDTDGLVAKPFGHSFARIGHHQWGAVGGHDQLIFGAGLELGVLDHAREQQPVHRFHIGDGIATERGELSASHVL